MKRTLLLTFVFALFTQFSQAQLQSPADFLGYELGDKWTQHHRVLDYYQHVAEESPRVTLHQYGVTNEGRELVYAVVTSVENQGNIEEIRMNNLKLTGLESGEPTENKKPIVWLSYNVHGNETSSSEAALNTIYKLITEKQSWLNDVIVVMDPMINPDGRDRYVNWYKSVVGEQFNALGETREHDEPWPGGRTNHYYFDLNRDWAWQVQKESQQRVEVYNQWMPHVHVDFHEQGHNSPYYFAPAAEPFHKAITDWQRKYQTMIGENHTKYFDDENWLYFTREVFDLFYPSYGDTWPTFNGAIGMTYEQAGGGYAGLGIIKAEGDTLTLKDRLMHHSATGLSTVEITAMNADRVLDEFEDYFKKAQNDPAGEYKTFVVSKDNNPDKIEMLLEYLEKQQIEVGVAKRSGRGEGYDYDSGETGRMEYEEGDYVISAYQPKGTLVQVLFEPNPELADSVTYDLTAWETHYAYGLDGVALKSRINDVEDPMLTKDRKNEISTKAYAYLVKWDSFKDMKYLAALLKKGVKVRYAQEDFTIDGNEYKAGTLIITRNGNEQMRSDFDKAVVETANKYGRVVNPVRTGMVAAGKDFGSSSVNYIGKPKVALLSGEGTSSGTVGQIWHFFDQQIEYPVSLINAEDVGSVDWDEYDVLILPSIYSSSVRSQLDDIRSWVRQGGTLIAVGGGNGFLAGKDGFALSRKDIEDEEEEDPEELLKVYSESRRERIQYANTGSVYEIDLDTTHPLAFGYDSEYMSLKLTSTPYAYLENGWNVGVAKEGAHRSGFVGNIAKNELEQTLSLGVQNMGRGSVVYMIDNPLYRGFWHNGKLLFGNAVFFVGR
ncbi:MAG: zinc carboxypeptidase [Balneolaceae bacterium]|nr:zinc carboxypeptidase [Balneolaceae bacterium]